MKGAVGDEVMEALTVSVGTVGINSKHCHGLLLLLLYSFLGLHNWTVL